MSGNKSRFTLPMLIASLFGLMLPLSGADKAPPEIIEVGTAIAVRTSDDIRSSLSDGKIFSGAIDQNVRDSRGKVTLLPRGADVELLVKRVSDHEYTLDLESITANGRRMGVEAQSSAPDTLRKVDFGDADRAGARGGQGAVVGAIVGALSWGGSGAEIQGTPGSTPRRDVQLTTRGKIVKLPANSLIIFRLEKPLRARMPDAGFSRNGRHFHPGYGTNAGNTKAFEAGLQAGRHDRQRNGMFNQQTEAFRNDDASDFQMGYERGFAETPMPTDGPNTIKIGADHFVRWNGPPASQVFVRIDNQKRLFSIDESGALPVPWIRRGHRYVFTLVDPNGKEIARDENDLRIVKKK